MAAGWSVMDALNRNSKAAAEDKPRARFRTKDISIRKMYSNDRNFYSMNDIDKLAQEILTVGLLENMTVMYAPCERGEYRIIAGERRWRALQLLLKKGYEEFEIATCQIKSVAEEHEEMVNIIMANAYRDKTMADLLQEEQQLRKSLQYMKDNGLTLQGYTLDSGRLRDVIASIMQMSGTKIAQIDSINERLIPEFTEQLKEGRLTFSAAYEISGMDQEQQQDMLEKSQESGGLTWKEVKEAKAAVEEPEEPEEAERQEPEQEETTKPGDDYETPHPEGITSICYGCSRYLECNVKTGTCENCDQYVNKAEAEKTDEQRYDEEQAAIDRETKRKLQEREQEEKMNNLPSDSKEEKEYIRLSTDTFEDVIAGRRPYLILKNDKIRIGMIVSVLEFMQGRATGRELALEIVCMDDAGTSSALEDGYCVVGIRQQEVLKEAGADAAEYADQPAMQYGA
jgi:ParB-like chromosome segregation protein Spo0J|nr:MAG TPA: chromosome partitioning protein [Caudoviricetes sp.]